MISYLTAVLVDDTAVMFLMAICGATALIVNLCFSDGLCPDAKSAVMLVSKIPAWDGVPEMTPLNGLSINPPGSPIAVNARGGLVAFTS